MSNKASDNLHRLIKAMSKTEKRYFKVFSSRHIIGEQNNYERLFDAIDSQEEYNEEKVLKKFKGEDFTKRFSIAKSRLYQSVLQSLDAFHANSSIDAQLKRQIHWAEILYKKSLYDQSLKLLKSARKVAEKNERMTSLIEIRNWEKRIIEKDNYEGITKKELTKILEKDEEIVNRLTIFNNLWNVKSRIFQALYQRGKARSEKELKQFKKIIDHVVLENSEKNMIGENAYLHNHLYSAYYYGIVDYQKSYDYLVANLKLIEEKPHIFKEEPNIYMSVLTNAIYLGTNLKKYDDAAEYLKLLNELPEKLKINKNEDLELRIFAISKTAELALYSQKQEFKKGIELIPEIEETMVRYEEKMSSVRKASIYFNIAVLYFWESHYNEALKWTNQLLNNIEIDKTLDIHCFGQLLNLVIHLELENKSLIPYTLRSTKRYLDTRNRTYTFETIFLEFINELLKKRQEKSEKELYENLASQLQELEKDPFERHVFEYFDFTRWARLKAQEASSAPQKETEEY